MYEESRKGWECRVLGRRERENEPLMLGESDENVGVNLHIFGRLAELDVNKVVEAEREISEALRKGMQNTDQQMNVAEKLSEGV